jgi:hypothetical protein
MVIRRVGPMSFARVAGVIYAVLGLVLGGVFALISMVSSPGSDAFQGLPLGAVAGVAAIIVFPVLYGCLGFIVFLIAATLYNAIANITGGIELDVEPSSGS